MLWREAFSRNVEKTDFPRETRCPVEAMADGLEGLMSIVQSPARGATWDTMADVVDAARAALSPELWDHSLAGMETDTAHRRNRTGFQRFVLRQRVLTGVTRFDTSLDFVGRRASLPVLFAPVGTIVNFHPEGVLPCASAFSRMGAGGFVAMSASPSLDVVRRAVDGPLVFQIYPNGDHAWIEHMVRKAERAGYDGIGFTVDTMGVGGKPKRELRNHFDAHARMAPPNLDGAPPTTAKERAYYKTAFNWQDVAWVRDLTRKPLEIKGILTPEDARLAVEHGVDIVYVSNHGGRQLDHTPSPIELVAEIVDAVDGKAQVVVDGGFIHGSDVVKAVALGAKAVAVGKLVVWAAAAGGEDGVVRMLEILQDEIRYVMAHLGAARLADLGRQHVASVELPLEAPWPFVESDFVLRAPPANGQT